MNMQLDFVCHAKPQLWRTTVRRADSTSLICVRGKNTGPFSYASGTFNWTRAVRALTILLGHAALATNGSATLTGLKGSLASSLDASLSKQTDWLADMFGTTSAGLLIAQHLLVRSNSGGRLPGPITVGLNTNLLSNSSIYITLDSNPTSKEALSELLASLECEAPTNRTKQGVLLHTNYSSRS